MAADRSHTASENQSRSGRVTSDPQRRQGVYFDDDFEVFDADSLVQSSKQADFGTVVQETAQEQADSGIVVPETAQIETQETAREPRQETSQEATQEDTDAGAPTSPDALAQETAPEYTFVDPLKSHPVIMESCERCNGTGQYHCIHGELFGVACCRACSTLGRFGCNFCMRSGQVIDQVSGDPDRFAQYVEPIPVPNIVSKAAKKVRLKGKKLLGDLKRLWKRGGAGKKMLRKSKSMFL